MATYALRRILLSLPSLLVVSFAVAGLIRVIPGDAVMALVSESGYVSPEDLDHMREEMGLNRPFLVQYVTWLGGAVRGDFGNSLWTNEPVTPRIAKNLLISLQMAIMAISFSIVLAIPLGVIAAVKRNSWMDYVSRLISILGLSVPDFVLATGTLMVLSIYFNWLPEFGWFPIWQDPAKNLQALIFPALIVGYRYSALSARMTRSSMLEVMREDYVRTARAKGLREQKVVVKHVLRNSLIPVITVMGSQISSLLGGLVIIETVFSLPGLGKLTFDAVNNRDYPMIQGVVTTIAVIYVIVNLAVDFMYAALDPRIRYS